MIKGMENRFNFRVERFGSLASSSTYIKEEFKKESIKSDCLCVIADQQTQGRGQGNHSWFSPKGNLYISFGIKTNLAISVNFSYLPLTVGKIVHSFLEQKFSINCYLKWPNDIYFGCRKLCGILCESMFQGDSIGVVIGIGINLKKIDYLHSDYSFKVDPISLEEVTDRSIDIGVFTKDFINYFQDSLCFEDLFSKDNKENTSNIDLLSQQKIFQELNKKAYLYPASYPYYDIETKKVLYDVPFDPDSYKTGLVPLYCQKVPFLGADIGNSRVKLFVILDNGEVKFYHSFDLTQKEDQDFFGIYTSKILDFLKSYYQNLGISTNIFPCHSIDVSSKNKELFLKYIPSSFKDIPVIKRGVKLSFSYKELGIDRACLLEGARSIYSKDRLILCSFGTATTIDILEQGVHKGGWILPGISSYFKSISTCSNLEDLTDEYKRFLDDLSNDTSYDSSKDISLLLGSSTKGCILNGFSVILISLFEIITRSYKNDTQVILTGGDASVIVSILKKYNFSYTFHEDSTLTAIGIKTMVKGG